MGFANWKSVRSLSALLLLAASLTACATQPNASDGELPGFLLGLFHGFIIMFSLIGSLFTDYRVYAYPNAGWVYDFGFFLGILMVFGGGGASASKTSRKKLRGEDNADDNSTTD